MSISFCHVRIPNSVFTSKLREKAISLKPLNTPPQFKYLEKAITPFSSQISTLQIQNGNKKQVVLLSYPEIPL